MAQVVAPFAVTSISSRHPALSQDLVDAFGLNASVPANGPIVSRDIKQAEIAVVVLEICKDDNATITEDVIQTAKGRAAVLTHLHSSSEFGVPTLANVMASLQRLEATTARIEAKLQNADICRRNTLRSQANPLLTIFPARQKEIAGDGSAKANAILLHGQNALLPLANVPNVGDVPGYGLINISALQHAEILNLAQFYNDDFDILPEDDLGVRQQRVINWLFSL